MAQLLKDHKSGEFRKMIDAVRSVSQTKPQILFEAIEMHLSVSKSNRTRVNAYWSENRNAVKFKLVIDLAKNKKAVNAPRDEIITAIRENPKTKKLVKPLTDSRLIRILRDNNALPGARRKP